MSNVFSNAFHIYQAEIFPTRMRATAVGTAYSLSRLTGAILPFITVAMLDGARRHRRVRRLGGDPRRRSCVDVGVLGPRSTGLNLEDGLRRRARRRPGLRREVSERPGT